jgi:ribonucleoside-diphosphate reductase alpha chain
MSFSTSVKAKLSPNALTVLQKRYLRKDKDGQPIETPADLFRRVARAVAAADQLYTLRTDSGDTAEEFYQLMADLEFLPNSPTLMNAGTELGQLSACFVLPVDDDMEQASPSLNCALRETSWVPQAALPQVPFPSCASLTLPLM